MSQDDQYLKRMQELAGVSNLKESEEERMEALDRLREELSDTEILDTLFEESFSDEEAEDHLKFLVKFHDLEDEMESVLNLF